MSFLKNKYKTTPNPPKIKLAGEQNVLFKHRM